MSDKVGNMSQSPAKSDTVGKQIMKMIRPAVPSHEKLTPVAIEKQATMIDPSPASTLGESATDGSMPVTPHDANVAG